MSRDVFLPGRPPSSSQSRISLSSFHCRTTGSCEIAGFALNGSRDDCRSNSSGTLKLRIQRESSHFAVSYCRTSLQLVVFGKTVPERWRLGGTFPKKRRHPFRPNTRRIEHDACQKMNLSHISLHHNALSIVGIAPHPPDGSPNSRKRSYNFVDINTHDNTFVMKSDQHRSATGDGAHSAKTGRREE